MEAKVMCNVHRCSNEVDEHAYCEDCYKEKLEEAFENGKKEGYSEGYDEAKDKYSPVEKPL